MHRDAQFARVAFLDHGVHDRAEFLDRTVGADYVPDLDVIRILRGKLAHKFAALLGRVDLHDRRIAEIELRTRDAGDERTGYRDAWRFRGRVRNLPHLEIPHWSADIDD